MVYTGSLTPDDAHALAMEKKRVTRYQKRKKFLIGLKFFFHLG